MNTRRKGKLIIGALTLSALLALGTVIGVGASHSHGAIVAQSCFAHFEVGDEEFVHNGRMAYVQLTDDYDDGGTYSAHFNVNSSSTKAQIIRAFTDCVNSIRE